MHELPELDKKGHRLRLLALAGAALSVALIVACGGDSKPKPNAGTAVASPVSTVAPATSTPATTSTSVKPAPLSALDSYRYSVRIESTGTGGPMAETIGSLRSIAGAQGQDPKLALESTGSYSSPDRYLLNLKIGSFSMSQTVIGNQQWVSVGGFVQGPAAARTTEHQKLSLAAGMWDNSYVKLAPQFSCAGAIEVINGVRTVKCGIDQDLFDSMKRASRTVPPEFAGIDKFKLEIRLAEQGGYPVRMRIEMGGTDIQGRPYTATTDFEVTDINKTVEIQMPR